MDCRSGLLGEFGNHRLLRPDALPRKSLLKSILNKFHNGPNTEEWKSVSDTEYVAEMTDTLMSWPIPESAVTVRKLRDRALQFIAENSDVSVVEALIPGMVVALADLEARIAIAEAGLSAEKFEA